VAGPLDPHLVHRLLRRLARAELLEPGPGEEVVLVGVVGLAHVHERLERLVHVLGQELGAVPPGPRPVAPSPRRGVRQLVLQTLQDPIVVRVVRVVPVSFFVATAVRLLFVILPPRRGFHAGGSAAGAGSGGVSSARGVAPAPVLDDPADLRLRRGDVAALHLDDAEVLADAEVRAGALLDLGDHTCRPCR
jgi:hypothetical protein